MNRNFFVGSYRICLLIHFPFSVSASNEALTDLLKVLMEKGTITSEEYTSLKSRAQIGAEKTSSYVG